MRICKTALSMFLRSSAFPRPRFLTKHKYLAARQGLFLPQMTWFPHPLIADDGLEGRVDGSLDC